MEKAQYFGLYRGTVVSNKDPLGKRRLKVAVPALTGNTPSNWAWPLEDAAIKTKPPAVNQGVWVMFENGDPAYPIWVGTFGKVVTADEHVLVSPGKVGGTYIQKIKFSDGRTEVDLLATLKAMSDKLDNLQATKADVGHGH
jgi:hypothetical protein